MMFNREESVGYMTNWAARLFARASDRQLKEIGISSGMLPIVFALCDGQSLSQKALAEYAAIEQATMANTLSRMEREGLIERRVDPADRRSQLISLTPSAMTNAKRVRETIFFVNAAALQDLEESERAVFLQLLKRVILSLERVSAKDV